MTRIPFLLVFALLGCRPMRTASLSECTPPQPAAVRTIPLDTLLRLDGRYRFITVAISAGLNRAPVTSDLTLVRSDTLERFYERRGSGYVRAGNRPLIGHLTRRYGDGQRRNDSVVVQQNPGDTQLISGSCTSCNDAMLIYHTISRVGRDGFTGHWYDPQAGIGQLVDKYGKPLSDTEGYFCAIRVRGLRDMVRAR
jgi:hypothetical protein